MTSTRIRIALAAAALATLAGGATTVQLAGAKATAQHVVTLKNIAFHPAVIRIKRGQSVTWRWEDGDIDTQHNVTSVGTPHFKSSPTQMTGTYTVTFDRDGTYRYECTIHVMSMQGKVIVTG